MFHSFFNSLVRSRYLSFIIIIIIIIIITSTTTPWEFFTLTLADGLLCGLSLLLLYYFESFFNQH